LRNTIGNVPIQWYEDYDHIGYDLRGEQIQKPEGAHKKGEIDEFLDKVDDPNYW
jgi:ribosome biogenesis protein ERB1